MVRKALYGWRYRVGAGGEDDATRAEATAVHGDLLRGDKARLLPEEDIYTHLPEAGRVVVLAGAPYDPVHHGRKVDLVAGVLDAVLLGVAHQVRNAGALDQGLGRHASPIQAVATEPVPPGEGYPRPQ